MSLSGFIHVAGWEDGEKVEKDLDGLDRWTTQNADTLRINISNDLQVHVKQDPHSKHLGGYLGAGIGFLGVVLEKLGAEVTITDIPELVPVIQKNMEINKCTKATAKALYWGKDNETVKELVAPDYVVLCDCVYSEANVESLVTTLVELCGPKTEVYSASELRNKDVYEVFLNGVLKFFDAKRVTKEELPKFDEVEHINVFVLTKKAS